MKIYVAMNAVPWERFSVTTEDKITISAQSNEEQAGFLPIFWSREQAERHYPGVDVSEAEVSDDWNPWLNEQKNG